MIWDLGLNWISPITFDADAFQTPENRGTQSRACTSTPWERCMQPAQEEVQQQVPPPMNRMYPLNRVPMYPQEQGHQSYDADTSARQTQQPTNTQGRFVPYNPVQPGEQHANSESQSGSQQSLNKNSPNETAIYNGLPN